MNAIAKYIMDRNVTKHLNRSQAVDIWNALKTEGWTKDKNSLVKDDGAFVFERINEHKTTMRYMALEVAL